MKKIVLLVLILISITSFGQTDSSKAKGDTIWTPKPDTEFISINDVNALLKDLGDKLSHNNFLLIQKQLAALVNMAVDRKRKNIDKKNK